MITYVLFILGFVVLIYGAGKLVDGAASLGFRAGMSQVVVGMTIVALGTSLPELFINIFASINGQTDLAIGNVLGSNIVNTYLIIGVAALIYPIKVSNRTANLMIPGTIFATAILWLLANDDLFLRTEHTINSIDGVVLLLFFSGFVYFTIFKPDKNDADSEDINIKMLTISKSVLYIIAGGLGLYFGGDWIVSGSQKISEDFNISQSFIGLTMIALATSLPELVTSIISARKKNSAMAIGNAIGSNILNIFFVLGISAIIHPIPYDKTLNIEVIMVIAASILLLTVVKWTGKKNNFINKWEGLILVLAYLAFIIFSALKQG
jgi:cation:H+ antiporter